MNFISIISLCPYTIVRLDRPENRSSLLEFIKVNTPFVCRVAREGRALCRKH